jgi:hypothetical protein
MATTVTKVDGSEKYGPHGHECSYDVDLATGSTGFTGTDAVWATQVGEITFAWQGDPSANARAWVASNVVVGAGFTAGSNGRVTVKGAHKAGK